MKYTTTSPTNLGAVWPGEPTGRRVGTDSDVIYFPDRVYWLRYRKNGTLSARRTTFGRDRLSSEALPPPTTEQFDTVWAMAPEVSR